MSEFRYTWIIGGQEYAGKVVVVRCRDGRRVCGMQPGPGAPTAIYK